jgi:hypothetical protein
MDVTATDNGAPPLSLTVSLEITVLVNERPWKNAALPLDVSGDGFVAPLDVLQIINELNNPKIVDAGRKLPSTRDGDSDQPYYDVNGDGLCTPLDALQIINYLNTGGASEGEAWQPAWVYMATWPADTTILLHDVRWETERADSEATSGAEADRVRPMGSAGQPGSPAEARVPSSRSGFEAELESLLDEIVGDLIAGRRQNNSGAIGSTRASGST